MQKKIASYIKWVNHWITILQSHQEISDELRLVISKYRKHDYLLLNLELGFIQEPDSTLDMEEDVYELEKPSSAGTSDELRTSWLSLTIATNNLSRLASDAGIDVNIDAKDSRLAAVHFAANVCSYNISKYQADWNWLTKPLETISYKSNIEDPITLLEVYDYFASQPDENPLGDDRHAVASFSREYSTQDYFRYVTGPVRMVIDAIIQKRTDGRDIEDESVVFTKADRLEVHIAMGDGIFDDELKEYLRICYISYEWKICNFVDYALNVFLPPADYIKKHPENHSFQSLLENFTNRKSKQVRVAREELLRRYNSLEADQQLAVRVALLQSNGMTDNRQGCKLCLERWDGSELPLLENLLVRNIAHPDYETWYLTSRLLCRHASIEYLLKNEHHITHIQGDSVNKVIYYHLSLRLIGENGFVWTKENLFIDDYYRLIYHRHLPFDAQAWKADFYAAMAELYVASNHRVIDHRNFTREGETFHCVVENVYKEYYVVNNYDSLIELCTVHFMLQYASLLGCPYCIEVLDYIHKVDAEYVKQAVTPPIFDFYCLPGDYHATLQYDHQRHTTIAEPLLMFCPDEYKHFFIERIQSYETWYASVAPELAKESTTYDPHQESAINDISDLSDEELRHVDEYLQLKETDNDVPF